MTSQRDVFLASEGDAWFERNQDAQRPEPITTLLRVVAPNASVLEIGCADGRNLAALLSRVPGRYVGVDPSSKAVATGRQQWPHLDLRVGTAESLPFNEQFDVVVLGFFLYLCDRDLLPRVVAEADRVTRDGGTLVIVDFDPPYPQRRAYRHRPGIWSYKMDYAMPFLALPSYVLAEKVPFHHGGGEWHEEAGERIAVQVLKKQLGTGYSVEPDV